MQRALYFHKRVDFIEGLIQIVDCDLEPGITFPHGGFVKTSLTNFAGFGSHRLTCHQSHTVLETATPTHDKPIGLAVDDEPVSLERTGRGLEIARARAEKHHANIRHRIVSSNGKYGGDEGVSPRSREVPLDERSLP